MGKNLNCSWLAIKFNKIKIWFSEKVICKSKLTLNWNSCQLTYWLFFLIMLALHKWCFFFVTFQACSCLIIINIWEYRQCLFFLCFRKWCFICSSITIAFSCRIIYWLNYKISRFMFVLFSQGKILLPFSVIRLITLSWDIFDSDLTFIDRIELLFLQHFNISFIGIV